MEIQITLRVHDEDTPVCGNALASGNDADDKACEDEILERLRRGDVWAWCFITVEASIEVTGERFSGHSSLGCCSYKDEADFRTDVCFADMVSEAKQDLLASLSCALYRGVVAARIVKNGGIQW